METEQILLTTLKKENYCLMTDENGKEILDEDGHLVVYNPGSGDLIHISNTKAVRELYDLNIDLSSLPRNIYNISTLGEKRLQETTSEQRTDLKVFCLKDSGEDSVKKPYKNMPEITSETTSALLKLMVSDKYNKHNLQQKPGRRSQWLKLYEELTSQGYDVPGLNKTDKVRKLCQKWRNIKKIALKHYHNKTRRKNPPPPKDYNLIIDIITKEEKRKGEQSKTGDDVNVTVDSLDFVAHQQVDHDYAGSSTAEPANRTHPPELQAVYNPESSPSIKQDPLTSLLTDREENSVLVDYVDCNNEHFTLPNNLNNKLSLEFIVSEQHDDKNVSTCELSSFDENKMHSLFDHTTDNHSCKSNSLKVNCSQSDTFITQNSTEANGVEANTVDISESDEISSDGSLNSDCKGENSTEILRQIKNLQEAAMIKQQENFTKVISLLEEQVKNQRTLNEMFFQYVTRRSNKPKSHIIFDKSAKK